MSRRDVVITGIGLVSSLGEGVEAHLAALDGTVDARVDASAFAPYPVHPLAPLELDRQIPKKSDQRQMEPWQRLGVYAAGLALDAAGLKDDAEAKSEIQVIVAAGGGERDHAVDAAILGSMRDAAEPRRLLNERLMSDLRPTLFLAQLSNLLAGNIAIVHGITGASRTFMGEEQAGVDALRIAQARIAAGQSDLMLVGGSYNAERRDMLLLLELGGILRKGAFAPVFARGDAPGAITGSVGAFLVLESAERARARGARIEAVLGPVGAARARRAQGSVTRSLATLIGEIPDAGNSTLAISAASGAAGITEEERRALEGRQIVASGDLLGHAVEAAFPAAVALAAASIGAGRHGDVLVTGAGHWRGEGAVRLTAAGGAA